MLEKNGIATVVIGSALDIVTYCKAPRFYFNDIPLGNPLGHPYNKEEQYGCVKAALEMIKNPSAPSVLQSEIRWHDGDAWRDNYMKVDDSNRARLKELGVHNRLDRRQDAERLAESELSQK